MNHRNTSVNHGTLEIQFDTDCSKVDNITIVDAHGFLDIEEVTPFVPLFDVILVHIQGPDEFI